MRAQPLLPAVPRSPLHAKRVLENASTAPPWALALDRACFRGNIVRLLELKNQVIKDYFCHSSERRPRIESDWPRNAFQGRSSLELIYRLVHWTWGLFCGPP
jgi:hypothetical protein